MRRAAPTAAGAALALIAGCGSTGGVDRAAYAQRVCSGIATFEAGLTSSGRALSSSIASSSADPKTIKQGASALLTRATADSATLLGALSEAGYPKGARGRQVAARLTAAARQAHDLLARQVQVLAAAPVTDRDAFTAVLDEVGRQVEAGGNALMDGLNSVGDIGDRKLNQAFAADASCRSL